jgi:phenylalanyl-tRNA synthetase beta chain
LVIADHQKALAMAGIMGGEGSGISGETRHLFLEAAFFAPELMAGRARHYGLHTDASHRYERGVDPELAYQAVERATQLFLECVGGEAGPVTDVTSSADAPQHEPVTLKAASIRRMLGIDLASDEVTRIFNGLGFAVEADTDGGSWLCTAPSWRFDMGREADLLEEIARIHGYDNIPVEPVRGAASAAAAAESATPQSVIKQRLVARGFNEAITFSFVSPELQQLIDPQIEPVALKNPISSDLAVMRTSLIPGLLGAAAHNINRQQTRVRLFETGLRFMPGESLAQTPMLGLLLCGRRMPEGWSSNAASVDFYDMKGEIEALLQAADQTLTFRPSVRPGLHDGQTAEILLGDEVVGVMGRLHPSTAKTLNLPEQTLVAELVLASVVVRALPDYQEISKFPEVRRDIAVIVNRETPSAAVLDTARASAGAALADARIFDVYEGDGVAENAKSLAIGLTFRDQSRTLTDEEINESLSQVIDSLGEKLGATLRH